MPDMLRELASTGVSLVGVDPSMTLAYRAEYVKALGKEAVPVISLPQEWLAERLDELPQLAAEGSPTWSLLPHCTERTNAPAATSDWVKVGRRLGVELQIAASGCCGMAGLYGHERANRSTSETIYGLSWGPILADARYAGRTLATGYSCRCQAGLVDGLQLMHPLQLLLRAVKAGPAAHSLHADTALIARARASRGVLRASRDGQTGSDVVVRQSLEQAIDLRSRASG